MDLSSVLDKGDFEKARVEPLAEFVRLHELVRPFAPPGAQLLPGVYLGPLVGTATGSFSPLFFYYVEMPLIYRDALEKLQAEGILGLRGFPTQLRFRQKNHPELLELEIHPQGRLHPDCTPERSPRCGTCGLDSVSVPEDPIVDVASLPTDRDLFRLSDVESVIIGTERFVETVQRLELEEMAIRELPLR